MVMTVPLRKQVIFMKCKIYLNKVIFKCQFDIKIKSKARTMTRDKEDHFIIIKDQCMKIYNPKHDAPYNRTSNNIKVKTYTTTKRNIQL